MNQKLVLFLAALGLPLVACAHAPSPRTVLDIVSDECVVLRKNTEDGRVHDACASVDQIDVWINKLASARKSAMARGSGSAHPIASGTVAP